MKNYLKFTLLLFALLLINCQAEENIIANQPNKSKYSISKQQQNELFKDEKIAKILNKLNSKNPNPNSRDIYDETNDFIISTDYATRIENTETGKYSLNFAIIRSNSNSDNTENLVLVSNNQNSYNAFVVKYGSSFSNIQNNPSNITTEIHPINTDLSAFSSNELSRIYYSCSETWTYSQGEHSGHELHGINPDGTCTVPSCSYNGVWILSMINCGYYDDGSGGGGSDGGGTGDVGDDDGFGNSGDDEVITSPVTMTPKQILIKKFKMQLSQSQKSCYNNLTQDKKDAIDNFLEPTFDEDCNGNPYTDEQQFNFLENLLADLCAGGQTAEDAWKAFENQFLVPNEGKDFSYDQAFWENPNLSFPQQNLPSWNDFYNGFPHNPTNGYIMAGADNVYGLVGGEVLQARISYPTQTENTCALKVSFSLNNCGILIPNIPGTLEGGGNYAGKFFFLNARSLNA